MFRTFVICVLAIVLVFTSLCVTGFEFVMGYVRREFKNEPFVTDVWRSADVKSDNVRSRMLTDLADRMRLEKWSLDRIHSELGPPPAVRPYPVTGRSVLAGRRVWAYPLGPTVRGTSGTRSLLIDPSFNGEPLLWTADDSTGEAVFYSRPPNARRQTALTAAH